MKAWRIERHGGPEVYQWKEIPTPEPGPMEVRIRVQTIGLNHMDLWARKGVLGFHFPLPMTPGCDIAGIVDQLGPGSKIPIGSEVVLNPVISCERCKACLSGFHPLCPSFGILGETQDGGAAEYVIAPMSNVILRPAHISPADAAAIPIPFVTAWSMITRKAQLKVGESILIHAAGSGVSMAAIQIVKLIGATVFTTVGSDEKISKARALGADYVFNYKKSNFREEIRKIKKSIEVVIDHIGADTIQESLKCLGRGGRLITCGATSGSEIQLDLKPIFFKNLSVLGSTMGSKADLLQILDLVADGKLKPIIDSIFPMSQYPKAVSKLESRDFFGKIMVQVG